MKFNFLILVLLVACSKHSGSSKDSPGISNPVTDSTTVTDVTDPLETGEQQQQTDGPFELNRTYNGTNVVLNYNSNRHLGMIRIKGKDAEELNKHMALTSILVQSQHVKKELEAKVGKHVMCRPDACWIYIDFKNGDVKENMKISKAAKAPRIIFPYKGDNLEMHMIGRTGRIFFEGMDAKALYSVMEIPEVQLGGKGSASNKKSGDGIECVHAVSKGGEKETFKCEVKFNHRKGAMKDQQE